MHPRVGCVLLLAVVWPATWLAADAILPPPAHTGGFSEPTCARCHTGQVNPPGGRVSIDTPLSYEPGSTRKIQITVEDATLTRWGFELSARFSNGAQAGTLESREPQSTVRPGNWNGFVVQYALQSDSPVQASTSFTFTVYWTAPPDYSKGDVIFNAVGMASNNDKGRELDHVYSVEMRSSGSPPKVSAGGVVSAASFQAAPDNQLAPGQLISIFGTGLTLGSPVSAGSIPLPTQLGSTQVRLGAQDLPLLYVSPLQINAQLSFEAAESGTNTLTVLVNGLASAAEPVALAAVRPALFTVSGTGSGAAAALHADFTSVNQDRPAAPGEIVLLFGTGLGLTLPKIRTGEVGKGEPVVAPVSVTMDGRDARVLFAGLAPRFVGLYQINAVVPAIATTGAVEVLVNAGGVISRPGVTLLVRP